MANGDGHSGFNCTQILGLDMRIGRSRPYFRPSGGWIHVKQFVSRSTTWTLTCSKGHSDIQIRALFEAKNTSEFYECLISSEDVGAEKLAEAAGYMVSRWG